MYNIDHFKTLIGAEIEALVSEINDLKKRVSELEGQVLHLETKNMSSFVKHEYIGHWNHKKIEDKTKVTCNTSEIV
jgi:predicted nuclease with TOPRIM domain